MTRQEAYDKIIERIELPENKLKRQDLCTGKLDDTTNGMNLKWYLECMKCMLNNLESPRNRNEEDVSKLSFDTSYRHAISLLDKQGWK